MNQPPTQSKIILIGDSCIDKTYYGKVNRISPEAPIPVLDYKYNRVDYGMTHNVYNNFINLGFSQSNIILDTSTYEVKKRYVDIKSKQQLLRVDSPYDDHTRISVTARINKLKTQITRDKRVDAIVICDYDKGHITYELVEELKNNYIGPIIIDLIHASTASLGIPLTPKTNDLSTHSGLKTISKLSPTLTNGTSW